MTGHVDPLMKGEALGILTSLMAASMVVGPIIGGALFEIHDGYPYFFAGLLMLVSLFMTLQFRKSPPDRLQPVVVPVNQAESSLR